MPEQTSRLMVDALRVLRGDDPAGFARYGSSMPEGVEVADLSDAQIEALYVRLTLRVRAGTTEPRRTSLSLLGCQQPR